LILKIGWGKRSTSGRGQDQGEEGKGRTFPAHHGVRREGVEKGSEKGEEKGDKGVARVKNVKKDGREGEAMI